VKFSVSLSFQKRNEARCHDIYGNVKDDKACINKRCMYDEANMMCSLTTTHVA
jgi:hypothetical protein